MQLLGSALALVIFLGVPIAQAGALDGISAAVASSGVKKALTAGADYAVSSLGKENGFLGNSKVRIPLPDSLQKADKALRTFGMGKQADQLLGFFICNVLQ